MFLTCSDGSDFAMVALYVNAPSGFTHKQCVQKQGTGGVLVTADALMHLKDDSFVKVQTVQSLPPRCRHSKDFPSLVVCSSQKLYKCSSCTCVHV